MEMENTRCRWCGCVLWPFRDDTEPSMVAEEDWSKHKGMAFNCTVREGWSRENALPHQAEPAVVDYVRRTLSGALTQEPEAPYIRRNLA